MKICLSSLILLLCCWRSAFCDEAEIKKKRLNDAMAERAGLMVEQHKLRDKMSKAWSDASYTSPEIEKLRNHYQQLKFEMIAVRDKLKREVKKLPEVRRQEQKIKSMRVQQKELEERIKKLNSRETSSG